MKIVSTVPIQQDLSNINRSSISSCYTQKLSKKMEGVAKVMLILTLLLGALTLNVNGARTLKLKEEVDHPQTFGIGGGLFPSPGLSGSFPSPGSFVFGSSSFCSLPGVRCSPVQPTSPFGSNGNVDGSG